MANDLEDYAKKKYGPKLPVLGEDPTAPYGSGQTTNDRSMSGVLDVLGSSRSNISPNFGGGAYSQVGSGLPAYPVSKPAVVAPAGIQPVATAPQPMVTGRPDAPSPGFATVEPRGAYRDNAPSPGLATVEAPAPLKAGEFSMIDPRTGKYVRGDASRYAQGLEAIDRAKVRSREAANMTEVPSGKFIIKGAAPKAAGPDVPMQGESRKAMNERLSRERGVQRRDEDISIEDRRLAEDRRFKASEGVANRASEESRSKIAAEGNLGVTQEQGRTQRDVTGMLTKADIEKSVLDNKTKLEAAGISKSMAESVANINGQWESDKALIGEGSADAKKMSAYATIFSQASDEEKPMIFKAIMELGKQGGAGVKTEPPVARDAQGKNVYKRNGKFVYEDGTEYKKV